MTGSNCRQAAAGVQRRAGRRPGAGHAAAVDHARCIALLAGSSLRTSVSSGPWRTQNTSSVSAAVWVWCGGGAGGASPTEGRPTMTLRGCFKPCAPQTPTPPTPSRVTHSSQRKTEVSAGVRDSKVQLGTPKYGINSGSLALHRFPQGLCCLACPFPHPTLQTLSVSTGLPAPAAGPPSLLTRSLPTGCEGSAVKPACG